jgi:chemotaxis protein CheD
MKLSTEPGDVIVTHALGSCLGITAYDPVACVGGMLHVMMPEGRMNAEKAKSNPFMFVDTGVPAFFRKLYDAGAVKARMVIKVAGGANVNNVGNDRFQIGKRNYIILKKLLWKNSVLIEAEDVGGSKARTMYLDVGSGRVWLSSAGKETEL